MLISKIIFKNKKNYFNVFIKKNTLNNNYYSFFKYIFTSLVYSFKGVLFLFYFVFDIVIDIGFKVLILKIYYNNIFYF